VSVQSRPRSPHRHVALFLVVTLVPSVLLVVLGWRLFQQDRTTALRQIESRREAAAALVVEALDARLATIASEVEAPEARAALVDSPGAVVISMARGRDFDVQPAGRVSYLPVAPPQGPKADVRAFAGGERLEYIDGNLPAAAEWFGRLTTAPDAAVRAGAMIRQAAVLRKVGRTDDALRVLETASRVDNVVVAGVPVELLARWARCDVLAAAGRTDALRVEAAALVADLQRGAWPVTRVVYEANMHDARTWLGEAGNVDRSSEAAEWLAAAVYALWAREETRSVTAVTTASAGHELIGIGDVPVTVVWRRTGDRFTALVATAAYVEREWLASVTPALDLQRVRVALRPPLLAGDDPDETRRSSAETGLPWTVAIATTNLAEERRQLDGRRTLWFAGLGMLVVLLLAGTAVSARTVSRELAMARLQTDFVAAVSHEFRTPLTTLRQLSEVLGDGRVVDESRRHVYYEALARQTERLHRLVESLLDFGRMEAGTSPYRPEPVEALAFAREVSATFAADAATRGAIVDLQVTGDPAWARIDRDGFGHALWNLLDNAVKYSPPGRGVFVNVTNAGSVGISVRDHGVGIPREEHRLIFDRFVRGSHAKAEGIRGTGIGLAIVSHVVTAHGGQVEVDSEPGAGSTFTVWLPTAHPTNREAVAAAARGSASSPLDAHAPHSHR
jgi:signal transduction histidine kinase